MYRFLLIPAALCVGLLTTASPAHAQRGRAGGGGGGATHITVTHAGGVNHATINHAGVNHGYYNHGYYNGAYYRPGLGIGLGFYGGGYPGGYYGSYYPYSSLAYDPYPYSFVGPRVSYYPYPVLVGQLSNNEPSGAGANSGVANIRVLLPDGDAKVTFDGSPTTQTGTERNYHTPALTTSGSYRIRASWMANGKEMAQESVAQVTPGQTTVIDFTRPPSEQVPAPGAK